MAVSVSKLTFINRSRGRGALFVSPWLVPPTPKPTHTESTWQQQTDLGGKA